MNDLREIQRLINDFAAVERSHYLPGTDRRESDIHHSYSVALLALYIHDHLKLSLNMEKVFMYALVHDLVEVYAGDVNSYANENARAGKKKAEADSLLRLKTEYAHTFPRLMTMLEIYESKGDPEAQFVWIVDKVQALVQGKEDDYRPFYEQGITSDDVRRVHGANKSRAYEPVKDYYSDILEEFLKEYDNKRTDPTGTVRAVGAPSRITSEIDSSRKQKA